MLQSYVIVLSDVSNKATWCFIGVLSGVNFCVTGNVCYCGHLRRLCSVYMFVQSVADGINDKLMLLQDFVFRKGY